MEYSTVVEDNDASVLTSSSMVDTGRKRKRLTIDERLNRNRERNRMHARKTRERKKHQSFALQMRINALSQENALLRQMVDERYTASSLLGLSQCGSESESQITLKPSSMLCDNYYEQVMSENSWMNEGASDSGSVPTKRVRRSGKYSPQEREKIRRERNRIHAKKTRDRKKQFLEAGESIIDEMVAEGKVLREYLTSLNMLSPEELFNAAKRQEVYRSEMSRLKNGGNDNDDDISDYENGYEQENENEDRSLSGSEETEKNSWNGSNDGSNRNSSNQSSLNGDTSVETNDSMIKNISGIALANKDMKNGDGTENEVEALTTSGNGSESDGAQNQNGDENSTWVTSSDIFRQNSGETIRTESYSLGKQ